MNDIIYSPLFSIFDTSPDGFFMVRDCVIQYANQVICDLAGENLCGKDVSEVFGSKLVDLVNNSLDETNTYNIDDLLIFKRRCSVRVTGTANGFLVTVTELAESAANPRAVWSPRAIRETCEEMRTPLTTIFSALNLIAKKMPENTPQKVKDYLSIINQNCYKLLKRSDYMADFSKYMENIDESSMRDYNIVKILTDFTEELRNRVIQLNVNFQLECSDECLIVACDITKLKRALLNLFVSMVRGTQPGSKLRLKLSHSGRSVILRFYLGERSLSEEDILTMFQKQSNKSGEGAAKCGFNLYFIKTVIEAHGGNLFLENNPVDGSNITIMLPKSDKSEYISNDPAPYDSSDFMLEMAELSDILPYEAYALQFKSDKKDN